MDSFPNFAYASSYLHLKRFAWKRDCPISSKPQTYRSWTRPFCCYFWHSNCHNFDYILGKVAKLSFHKAHRSLSKQANVHINRPPLRNTGPLKKWKNVFWRLFFKIKIAQFWIYNKSNIWVKFYHAWKKGYRGQLLLKLWSIKVATSFHWISTRSF